MKCAFKTVTEDCPNEAEYFARHRTWSHTAYGCERCYLAWYARKTIAELVTGALDSL